jgi:hypothetical protein
MTPGNRSHDAWQLRRLLGAPAQGAGTGVFPTVIAGVMRRLFATHDR